mmetsp:Transcript_27560/g.49149  ORF Transcript_27560/g.49149 Transcript_27560/m.49149 type:complete len:208 (-) Transcript_27560:42-665(-)
MHGQRGSVSQASQSHNVLLRQVVCGQLSQVSQGSSLNCWRSSPPQCQDTAFLRRDLAHRIQHARISRDSQLSRRHKSPISLHSDLHQICRHRDELTRGSCDEPHSHFRHRREDCRVQGQGHAAAKGFKHHNPRSAVRNMSHNSRTDACIESSNAFLSNYLSRRAESTCCRGALLHFALQLQSRLHNVYRKCQCLCRGCRDARGRKPW